MVVLLETHSQSVDALRGQFADPKLLKVVKISPFKLTIWCYLLFPIVDFKFKYVVCKFLGINVSSLISTADTPGLLLYQGDKLVLTRMLWNSELSSSVLLRSMMSRVV
jgi:hypothetical protein